MAFMGTKSASSSSSSTTSGFKYDVFLSFRGCDTRKNFTDRLYAALNLKGIRTFRDDEKLERGTFIAPELLRAIEESRLAIVIISQNYASSSWCLAELAKIVECMEKERLIVLPVFQYIDPSDVRNLRKTVGEAFAKHEERYKDNIEEVHRWKAALTKVANFAGWDLRDKHEGKVVEGKVVEEIVGKILDKLTFTYSIVHKDFVGINSRMEELVNLLGMGLNDVRFIGFWGLGKTTLARVVYDNLRHCFEGSSFLANVREECGKHGLVHLQKQLLSDILIERNIDFSDVQWGSNVIEKRLCYKSVLIVLDDVDQLDQLEALAGERVWFGQGSRVIITTRDQHLLIEHDVAVAEIYKAEELNSDEALQLFSRKAFNKDHPSEGYVELSKKEICYAQGLPLALEVPGSFLKYRKPDAWESALDRLKEAPPKTNLDKQLFMLQCSRIRLSKIFKQEFPLENLINVNLSGCEFIMKLPKLWGPNLESLKLAGCENLVKLTELRAPNLNYLDLSYCENLVEIDECFGSLEKLTTLSLQGCRKLQILPSQLRLKSLYLFILSGCSSLEELPNFHPEMECLNTLELEGSGIREVPSSIEHLTKLEKLNLYHCKNLRDLPDSIYKLQQLQILRTNTTKLRPTCDSFDGSSGYGFVNMTQLNLHGCEGIIELDLLMKPDYFPALESIDLSETNIVTIPESISRFPKLKSLYIRDCKFLREIQGLPQSIRCVDAEDCMLLDTQSPRGLLNQVIEIIGILPSRVCGRARSHILMDPQLTKYFPSETEGAEYEDGDIDHTIYFWGTEMPKWFNHQSVDNSISFFVGRKFPKLAVCIVVGSVVEISINGYEKREYGYFYPSERDYSYNLLLLHSPSQWRLQQQLNESNPTDQNLVKVTSRAYEFDDDDVEPNSYIEPLNPTLIKRWGVHVECTCPPQELQNFDFCPSQEYETLSKHLKRLFYCSLFPLGYEFGREEMVQLWIAEGFIEERQRMEDTGCEYFVSLVSVGFIQFSRYDYSVDFYSYLDEFDSNGGTGKKLYKVNEAQASHLKMAISEGSYQSVLGDKLDVASELTLHLSLPCESINDQMVIEALKRCTNLRTLLLLSGCGYNVKQVPRDLFWSLKLLRTLNLSHILISELPSSIGNVKSLRYLDVSNTHIRRLPESIDCLSNLQTLKLRGCLDFVALPKNMKKLTNLRHLELDMVRQLISMPSRIGNLTNLQTLSAFLVGRDDECGIEELKNMNDLCGTFCISRLERVSSLDKAKEAALIDKKYLNKLVLRWSDIRDVKPEEEKEILESLRPHSGLREIKILFYGGFKIPSWISDPSFADLVAITLYKCTNCGFFSSLGDLPSLKFLCIREMNEVKKIDRQFCRNNSDKRFAKLEKLEINVMLNLEEWKEVENGDLPVLRKLTVEYFPKLIALPSLSRLNSLEHLEIKHCSGLQCLPNDGLPTSLEFLLIRDCPELKERCCKGEGLDWGKIKHVPNIWIDHQEISSS